MFLEKKKKAKRDYMFFLEVVAGSLPVLQWMALVLASFRANLHSGKGNLN